MSKLTRYSDQKKIVLRKPYLCETCVISRYWSSKKMEKIHSACEVSGNRYIQET